MSDIIFAPKSAYQNQWETSVRHRNFKSGMVNDGPKSRVPDNGMHRIINYLNRIDRLDARQGSKQWSVATINDLAMTGYTGYASTSSVSGNVRTITKSAGASFVSTMVGKWFVFDNLVAEQIKSYTSATEIKTYTQRSQAITTTAGKIRDKCYGQHYHSKQKKFVVQVGSSIYVSDGVNVNTWTQAYCDTEDALTEANTIFDEFQNFVFFANGSMIYKLDLTATPLLFYAINVPSPTAKILGNETLFNTETNPYRRRYIYGMLRARYSSTGHHNRETPGVVIERESATTAFAQEANPTRITVTANSTDNTLTATAHGLVDNQQVRMETTSLLPGNLTDSTVYYVVWVDANTIKLSTALDGEAVDLTTTGTGTQYVVPNTDSGADFGEISTPRPVGEDGVDGLKFGRLSGKLLESPHDVPSGWSVYEDARFGMTMNGASADVTCDFSNSRSMVDVATKIQSGLRAAFKGSGATCVYQVSQKAFTADESTNKITFVSGHGFSTGDIVSLVSTGTLPAGLTANVFYYLVVNSGNTFELSLSSGGASIDFTTNGTGILYAIKNGSCGRFKIESPNFGGKVSIASRPISSRIFTVTVLGNLINLTAHGYEEGQLVTFSTTSALPTGLYANTRYYVINPTTDSFGVALGIDGTAVAITGTGTGTHYLIQGGFDVSTYLGFVSGATASPPKYYNSSIVQNLQLPLDASSNVQAHDTHYCVYSTADVGPNGIDPVTGNANQVEEYIWNADVPVVNALIVSATPNTPTAGFTLLTATQGSFYREDEGSTLVLSDGSTRTRLTVSYLSSAAGSTTRPLTSAYAVCVNSSNTLTARPAAIGDERGTPGIKVYKCSQSNGSGGAGTTVTKEAGDDFTTAIVGKKLYWQNFSSSYVVSYTSSTQVTVADSTLRTSLACASDPYSRKYMDSINDDVLTDRRSSWPCDLRLYDPIPASNIVAICPGVMVAGLRDGTDVYYSPMAKSFEHYAGYYYASDHYLTVKDKIQHIIELADSAVIFCSNSTHSIDTNRMDIQEIKDIGIAIAKITGQSVRDKAIGITHFSSACKSPTGGIIVITNEPGIRVFDGVKYGENYASGKIGDILKKARRIYSIGWDQITGLNFWLSTDINKA